MHLGVKGKAPPSSKVIRRLCRGQPPSSTRPLAFVSAADATSFARATVVLSKPHPAVTPNFKQTAPKKRTLRPCQPVNPRQLVQSCHSSPDQSRQCVCQSAATAADQQRRLRVALVDSAFLDLADQTLFSSVSPPHHPWRTTTSSTRRSIMMMCMSTGVAPCSPARPGWQLPWC